MYALSQPINDITLNGQEFALDENEDVKLFNTITEAHCFAYSAGASKIDFENGCLNVCEIKDDGSYEVVA